jgi:hypothetical protein
MTEHYPDSTEWVIKWCNACSRHTKHSVSGGRVGHCMEHEHKESEAARKDREKREALKKQGELF